MQQIPESELILNPDGSIYHLNLRPEHIADTIITVGDPDRVPKVSRLFDKVEHKIQKREFVTHTGVLNGKRLTVMSTGMGTDNIDIALNELDALVNIDLQTRQIKEQLTSLNIIRIGTSGCLQADIPVDSLLFSEHAIGLDGLMHYYHLNPEKEEQNFTGQLDQHLDESDITKPYMVAGSGELIKQLTVGMIPGITLTCPGFYAPQGRVLRLASNTDNFIKKLNSFRYKNSRLTNFEMETAGIYGMAKILGHKALSCNAILANRITHEFSQQPQKVVEDLIEMVLERV